MFKKSIFTCDWCKKEFEEWTYRKPRFCSRQCLNEFASKQPRPNYHGHKENKVIWKCKQCGKEMKTFKSRVRDTCSKRCARIYNTPRTEFICKQCGKHVTVTYSYLRLLSPKFCSKECSNNAHSIKMSGSHNPNWRGGNVSPFWRGDNWGKQSRATRKRDNHICQSCGEYGIDVHHIKPFRSFNGDWKSANQLSNLVTLCTSCHSKIEHNKIPCPKPKS